MATIIVPRRLPSPTNSERRARNTLLPSALAAKAASDRINWAAVHGVRRVHQDAGAPDDVTGTSNTTIRRGAFHSSESPGGLYLNCQVAVKRNQSFQFSVNDGTTTTLAAWVDSITSTSLDDTAAFDGVNHLRAQVALDADKAYTWKIDQRSLLTVSGFVPIRPAISCMIWESCDPFVDTDQPYVSDTRTFYPKGPIYDADVEKTIAACYEVWKHGPQLISVSAQTDDDYFATSSASYVNALVSGGSTTVSSTSPGFNLPLTYQPYYHTNDIRAVFAVHARQDAGTANNAVKLEDASGTLGTLSNFSSSAFEWKTVAVTLTGGASYKADIHFKCDGTNELRVDAMSLYIRET